MKNILIIDRSATMIESLSESKEINIVAMIVETEAQKHDLQLKYDVKDIFTNETINEVCEEYKAQLDYELIRQYRHTQVKVENFFHRFVSDINLIQYIYVNALLFWNDYFANHNIDMVILTGIEHGFSFDSVLLDIAVKSGKDVYLIEPVYSNGDSLHACVVLDYVNKEYLSLDKEAFRLHNVTINEYLYYQLKEKRAEAKGVKEYLKRILYRMGGFLLVMFVSLVLGRYRSVHFSISISWWQYFKNFIYMKKIAKYYDSISCEFDNSKKCVLYALHMEPEAATQARAIFSNQLIIIKTIAQSLPKDWILYVKEHPHQWKLNSYDSFYYLAEIDKFRSKEYYKKIIKYPNVKLLNMKTNTKDIIKKVQAISSINGTILFEAVAAKKSALCFSQDTLPLKYLDDICYVQNHQDVADAFEKINRGVKPKYNDFDEALDKYFFEVDSSKKTDYKYLVESLISRKES